MSHQDEWINKLETNIKFYIGTCKLYVNQYELYTDFFYTFHEQLDLMIKSLGLSDLPQTASVYQHVGHVNETIDDLGENVSNMLEIFKQIVENFDTAITDRVVNDLNIGENQQQINEYLKHCCQQTEDLGQLLYKDLKKYGRLVSDQTNSYQYSEYLKDVNKDYWVCLNKTVRWLNHYNELLKIIHENSVNCIAHINDCQEKC